ncbi:hypothetical protein Cni_G25659 [Canna indica]|uniref:LysM domain-containing protein n=1 Tax=Canna indica TaxID=4628 RepID=A0AAQ3L281_9LILI|nr:hypothetical protein Cni_G25659 [Canna indica]
MQAERAQRSSQLFADGSLDGTVSHSRESGISMTPASSSSCPLSPSDSTSSVNYIEHRVSKMDTLPGIAIKYGVEVADIKRLNGLVTDIEMFAHKILRIPLPGRHPPSPCLPNGSAANGNCSEEHTPSRLSKDLLDLFHTFNLTTPPSKVSPAMSNLQAYYGLAPLPNSPVLEGTEMPVHRSNGRRLDDEFLPTEPPNGFSQKNGGITKVKANLETAEGNEIEKSIRRRQKNDVNLSFGTPEMLLKEDNSNGFSGSKGKSLAVRPKSGSRTDTDMVYQNAISNGDSSLTDGFVSVRKSSSTSSLQESENSSSTWLTSKWSLKPEVLAKPLFDGLPKPITAWMNKAALD